MKKGFHGDGCLVLPGLLFLNAWQGYRYNELADQVAALEKLQSATLDANRDVIAQIAFETSPARVAREGSGGGRTAESTGCILDHAFAGGASAKGRDGPVMASATERVVISFADIAAATGGRILFPARKAEAGSQRLRRFTTGKGWRSLCRPGRRAHRRSRVPGAGRRRRGCSVLVSDAQAAARTGEIERIAKVRPGIISVPDTLQALQDLARFHMKSIPVSDPRRRHRLQREDHDKGDCRGNPFPCSADSDQSGEPELRDRSSHCLLLVEATHRYAVLEMGMNRVGEMDILADIVRPDLALITNIGTAHIGLLGSRDAIAAEKKKIFAHFDGKQTAFIPENTPLPRFPG